MKRILVIGGYGGFGAKLSRALAADGYVVLVAGRSLAKAQVFCAEVPNTEPLVLDRNGDIAGCLSIHRPDLVIDAAGPFQNSSYAVPEACIAARLPYLDLADGRDFVCGIGALDAAARAAGIAVITGASSVPALSGAVIRHLRADMDTVSHIEMSISASNRATAGASVAASILSYVGKPIRLWRGGRWKTGWGWQSLKRQHYRFGDGRSFHRLVALADVPDLGIFPVTVNGAPEVIFRAGPELAFQTLALWLVSWPIRWGWVASLAPFVTHLNRLHALTARLGGDRSAMRVEVRGLRSGAPITRIWTLIAEQGDGPNIPVMAARLLTPMILSSDVAVGAQTAANLLTLDQFEPLFATFAIHHHTTITLD